MDDIFREIFLAFVRVHLSITPPRGPGGTITETLEYARRWAPEATAPTVRRSREEYLTMKKRRLSGLSAGTLLLALGVGWQAPAQERAERPAQVIRNGRLVGTKLPADWKLSERAKNLTYNNPFNQNLAARWVDGEIVYRVSFGEVAVDPTKTKVAREYIAVYSAPGPGDPPTKVERVPDQLAIYDSKPGDPEYSPIWHYHYVVVPRDYKANTLRSEEDVKRMGYRVVPVDHFSN